MSLISGLGSVFFPANRPSAPPSAPEPSPATAAPVAETGSSSGGSGAAGSRNDTSSGSPGGQSTPQDTPETAAASAATRAEPGARAAALPNAQAAERRTAETERAPGREAVAETSGTKSEAREQALAVQAGLRAQMMLEQMAEPGEETPSLRLSTARAEERPEPRESSVSLDA